eukprot:1161132-Pelagomonas_calceolata.AAC.5
MREGFVGLLLSVYAADSPPSGELVKPRVSKVRVRIQGLGFRPSKSQEDSEGQEEEEDQEDGQGKAGKKRDIRDERREELEAIRRNKRAYGKTSTAGGHEVRGQMEYTGWNIQEMR